MKQKLTIGLFLIFIFGILILNVVFSDQELSKSERRKLTMLPKLSTQEFFQEYFLGN